MVANPERGETKVTIEGVDYVLAWTFNSLIVLQQMFKKDGVTPKMEELLQRAKDEDYEVFRAIFWCLFERYHPHVTLKDAGYLITGAGGIQMMNAMLDQAMSGSAPTPEDTAALRGASGNPPKAARAKSRRGRLGAH